jgi:predicted N-acetyltransferase YhbS
VGLPRPAEARARRAGAEDAPTILEVTKAANGEYAGSWVLSAAAEDIGDVRRDLERGCAFVAAVGAECVGAIRRRLLEDGGGYIKRLAALPQWRRRGVATGRMRAAEEHLRRTGRSVARWARSPRTPL